MKLGEGVLSDFGVVVPEEVAGRLMLVESPAADALELEVTFGLVLLDAQALDVEPLFTLVLTLHHH